MKASRKETPPRFPGPIGVIFSFWFLVGMLLNMLGSGIASLLGVRLPPAFFFLSSLVYLGGGLMGWLWGRERLYRKGRSSLDIIVSVVVLLLSVSFLLCSILFLLIGLRFLQA